MEIPAWVVCQEKPWVVCHLKTLLGWGENHHLGFDEYCSVLWNVGKASLTDRLGSVKPSLEVPLEHDGLGSGIKIPGPALAVWFDSEGKG